MPTSADAPEPVLEGAPSLPFTDPADVPCPAVGWATPASLVGPWSGSFGSSRYKSRIFRQVAERHDYLDDGTVLAVRIVRTRPSGAHSVLLPRPEEREDAVGTWSVDPSGVRELRIRSASATRVSRERVWISVEPKRRPTPTMQVRVLGRDPDGAWRGEVYFEESAPAAKHGYESRVELRFDPPLTAERSGPLTIQVRRSLRVWGGGRPATWSARERHTGVVEGDRVVLDQLPSRVPGQDERLWEAFRSFDVQELLRASDDALIALRPLNLGPARLGRNTDPPILWHDIIDEGRCTRLSSTAP